MHKILTLRYTNDCRLSEAHIETYRKRLWVTFKDYLGHSSTPRASLSWSASGTNEASKSRGAANLL
jgi:hypothetical protein